ncbi:PKc-like superfamily domain-containing protein [Histoplasma ohiense]|nr:PKc-like superfamily domain-containing protein [Histoplasma ohiense (nom. inval.)]
MANIRFVKENTQIPIPSVIKEWTDDNDRHFVLMERIKGQTLEDAWPTLSSSDKERIADQVAKCLVQLRSLQSPQMRSLNHRPLYSGWLFLREPLTPHGPFTSETEFWDYLSFKLTKLPKEALARLRTRLPTSAPYTFTHGDLAFCNIIVKDGNLAGILDWEDAGYFPVWWEYVAATIGLDEGDAEWKALLRGKLGYDCLEAKNFWRDFYSLHFYPDLDEAGQQLLETLLEDSK